MGDVDATGRATRLRQVDLARFFSPRTVCVIGATDDPCSPSWMSWDQLRRWAEGAGARVVPVNPKRTTVDGLECFPSVLDVPGEIDLAAILIGRPELVLPDVASRGVGFAVLFSAGFAETGEDGEARQEAIVEMLAGSELRLLGPNTTLNAFQPFQDDVAGARRIGLITQSGHQGRPIYQAQELGIGLKAWAPTGNEADLEAADFIGWFARQEDVGTIAAYIEGFKDGRSLCLAADEAARHGTPIVVVKVGRSDLGRSWAKSHSGHLAGSDRVMSAAFRQFGITRVDALDELLDVSQFLARAPAPSADGLAIYSISGGTGAHVADLAAARGLPVPEFEPETQELLHEWIAPFLRVSNPVDSGGHPTGDERGPKILRAILDDPNVGALLVPIPGAVPPISETFARDIVDAAKETDKAVAVVWGSPVGTEPAYRDILLPSGVPVFRTVGNALTALGAWRDHHAFTASYESPFSEPASTPSGTALDARRVLGGRRGALPEASSKELLAAYGIPTTRERVARSGPDAVRIADELGHPVVMKISSSEILHKSDLGLVQVGVEGAEAVRSTYDELMRRATEAAPDADVDGVLVSEMVTGGVETILGVVQDELFGPVVMFGIGGVSVEVYDDVTFRIPPFTRAEAARMVREVRGLPLLTGSRGRPAVDLGAIEDTIMRLQQLALDLHDEIVELDVNPLVAGPDGVVALDALVVLR